MKSLVLLSSGLDSTVNLYQAVRKTEVVTALTFDYSQRAAKKELSCARGLARKLGVPHKIVQLPFFQDFPQSSLTNKSKKIPKGRELKIDHLKTSQKSAKSVWVPNRNGIFLNIAAGFAEALGAQLIIPGFNIEEASTFPDNSSGFLKALDQGFAFSTSNHVKTHCYTTHLNKTQIVRLGEKLKVDWSLIWPCYHSGKKWCGECESCLRSLRAFQEAGVQC